jgi:hypothetical protein
VTANARKSCARPGISIDQYVSDDNSTMMHHQNRLVQKFLRRIERDAHGSKTVA